MPCSTMRPSSITRMTSAPRIVERRWAITKLVRSARSAFIASWISTSVRVSTELVASSRMRIGRLGEEGAGDGEQLLLPGADVVALLVDHRVVAVGQVSARSGRRRWPWPRRGSPPRWRRGCRRRCCRGSCRRTATCPAAPCRCCDAQLARAGSCAMSRPSSVMRAAVELVEPHDEVDERRLAGAGRARRWRWSGRARPRATRCSMSGRSGS